MAGIVPKGKVQFLSGAGVPLAGGSVAFYVPGTTTPLATYTTDALTTANPNPVILDGNGEAVIWGYGSYRQIVTDASGNSIWDEVVSVPTVPIFAVDTGVANAMAVSIPGFAALTTGQELNILPAAGNTDTTNLTINGTITAIITQGALTIPAASLAAGYVAKLIFDGTNLQLLNSQIPPTANIAGEIRALAGATAPTGWQLCYGQAVSRTTYANLFAAIGTTWGAGDGATTFNVPDLRGRALFGVDAMGGAAANRVTSNSLGGSGTTATAVALIENGIVTAVLLTYSGTGYTSVPTITISGGGGTAATAQAVIANGSIMSITLLTAGANYTSSPTVTIAPATASTTATLGVTGGSELVQTHDHGVTDPEHYHSALTDGYEGSTLMIGGQQTGSTNGYYSVVGDAPGGVAATTNAAATGITIANFGSGNSQNLPPAAIITWVIFNG